jgi:hypothetical protein
MMTATLTSDQQVQLSVDFNISDDTKIFRAMARSGSCPVTAQQTSGGGFRFRRFRAAFFEDGTDCGLNRLWVAI